MFLFRAEMKGTNSGVRLLEFHKPSDFTSLVRRSRSSVLAVTQYVSGTSAPDGQINKAAVYFSP